MATANHKNRLAEFLPRGIAEVDSLFEHLFGAAEGRTVARRWDAPAALWEADDRLHLEIDAPGVARDGVEVTFDRGQLTVTLERTPAEGRRYRHNERGFGKVTRTVVLPETVDPDSIEAELTDGVLSVSIAKRPEAQPKRVELK